MSTKKPRVLCVDDEPGVLAGIRLNLRKKFVVELAESGSEGLEKLASSQDFAVVLSDMRMPKMNGAEFLKTVRERHPNCVRMLLTGQTDLDAAIMAVNEGQIFRFLTKPCAPDQLRDAFEAANAQHQLLSAEKVLLEQTLNGSVQTLIEVLSLTQPAAFGHAARTKSRCQAVATILKVTETWPLEVAAMLARLGVVTLSDQLLDKWYAGTPLSEAERIEFDAVPEASIRLLSAIPRLEPVLAIIRESAPNFTGQASLQARILRCVLGLDALELQGRLPAGDLSQVQDYWASDTGPVLEALDVVRRDEQPALTIVDVSLAELKVDMLLVEDVYVVGGALLVAKGTVVTSTLVQRLRSRGEPIVQPLKVGLPKD